jgi:hypothetical protein
LTVFLGDGKFTAMDSKPTIEQFIYSCFRERTAALRRRLEIHQVYRRRYYDSECHWDSRRGVVERSEAERIVDVSPSEIEFGVVTIGGHPNHRSRYHVKSSGESWLIREVDLECVHCVASGVSTKCAECGGSGWQSWKQLVKCYEERAIESARSNPDEESEGRPFHDPNIQHFMNDHFRERTEKLKKEMEIHADYAKRFYDPECDWARWAVSVQGSEAERIVNMVPVDTGARVITRHFVKDQRLRYHLRPKGQSWLIWDVDSECPLCYREGRRAHCFLCGGTIWERKKAR